MIDTNEFRDKMIDAAKDNFNKDGEARPMAIFLKSNNQLIMMPLSMGDQSDKDEIASVIKLVCKKDSIVAMVLIWEAWMVKREKENFNKREIPSTAEDRQEILMITYETKLISQIHTWDILRDKSKPYLVHNEAITSGTHSKGRFANLLTEPVNQN